MLISTIDLKWAQTLDGQLCDDADISQWITGPEELRRTHLMRREYDAVLVGARTFLTDHCRLTVRLVPLLPDRPQPARILLDGNGRLIEALLEESGAEIRRELESGDRPTIIIGSRPVKDGFFKEPVYYIHSSLNFSDSTEAIIRCLNRAILQAERQCKRTLRKILVEGGPRVLSFFLNRSLHRHAHVSIAPCLTGGRKHRLYLDRTLRQAIRFDLQTIEVHGSDILSTLTSGTTGEARV